MFVVCRDHRKEKLIVVTMNTARKFDYLEVLETATTYRQAERRKEELLGKGSSQLGDIVRRKD
ncbi:MAG: hypothetical protein IJK30_08665 [Ruminococcus sp.]|nr:hypothetical protein [Ruminococcus sp.]